MTSYLWLYHGDIDRDLSVNVEDSLVWLHHVVLRGSGFDLVSEIAS